MLTPFPLIGVVKLLSQIGVQTGISTFQNEENDFDRRSSNEMNHIYAWHAEQFTVHVTGSEKHSSACSAEHLSVDHGKMGTKMGTKMPIANGL